MISLISFIAARFCSLSCFTLCFIFSLATNNDCVCSNSSWLTGACTFAVPRVPEVDESPRFGVLEDLALDAAGLPLLVGLEVLGPEIESKVATSKSAN
jgi:hypothetical protein